MFESFRGVAHLGSQWFALRYRTCKEEKSLKLSCWSSHTTGESTMVRPMSSHMFLSRVIACPRLQWIVVAPQLHGLKSSRAVPPRFLSPVMAVCVDKSDQLDRHTTEPPLFRRPQCLAMWGRVSPSGKSATSWFSPWPSLSCSSLLTHCWSECQQRDHMAPHSTPKAHKQRILRAAR